jgi:DMSO/TMAO reductase YedYZ molybdopterin-dependent catalytic subunit
LNDAALDPDHGAPVRLRIPTQLGYKSAKWVERIELVSSFATIYSGGGGYWEDQGYEWYAGI